jgi:Protein of unknown function (DUF3667)
LSHLKERKENNCLNCNAQIQGRFCHICGQENIEPKESVWHLINHFFQDITHFDGKFFSSLKYLITKPGFLSREYMIGRRASYLNPIRMYIFTSAFFFLIFFSFFKVDKNAITKNSTMNGKTYQQTEMMDSLAFDAYTKNINKEDGKKVAAMTREEFKKYFDSSIDKTVINFTSRRYKSKAEYDSVIKSGKKDHNWVQRQLIYKEIEINEKFKANPGEGFKTFVELLMHSLPQMFFISLPLFALLLRLLYVRRKDYYYYVSHGIFSIHFYIFIFIALLFLFGLNKLNNQLHWQLVKIIQVILSFGLFFYLYKAMGNFYQQRRAKTIIKFLILCSLLLIVLMLLFVIFVFFSLFKL